MAFLSVKIGFFAQTDFPALKQQFLDYRKANNQDSALFIARKMNQLALKEQTDSSYWYALSWRYIGNPHYTWGNTDSTIFYWRKSLKLFEKYHSNSSDYASSLNSLGILYRDLDDYKTAEPFLKQALEIRKQVLGEEHPEYASSLNNLGNLFWKMGNYKAAEPYYKQALEIKKKALGEEHLDYANSVYSLGLLYKEMGEYKAAEPLYRLSLEIKKKALGEEHPDYASSLNNLGFLFSEIGKYDSSIILIRQSIDILWENNRDSSKLINQIHSLAYLLNKTGKYLEAQEFYLRAIRLLNSNHPIKKSITYNYDLAENYVAQAKFDIALPILIKIDSICRNKDLKQERGDILYSIGKIHSKKGKYDLAQEYYVNALKIREEILPKNHPDLAVSYNSVAVIQYKKGEYRKALPNFIKALEIRKIVFGEQNADITASLMNIGVLYQSIGDYNLAEEYLKECVKIQIMIFDSLHPKLSMSYGELGNLYIKKGMYREAEKLYTKSSRIYKKALGEEHPDYAGSLQNLGNLFKEFGDFFKSEKYYLDALRIYSKVFGDNHPSVATIYNNLGDLYMRNGNFSLSEQMLQKDIQIKKNSIGDDHPEFAISVNTMANLQQELANYELVDEYIKKALEIRLNSLGENHPEYISTLRSKGLMLLSTGNYDSSRIILQKVLEYRRIELGIEHPDYAISLIDMGDVFMAQAKYKSVDSLYNTAKLVLSNIFGENHPLFANCLYKIGRFNSITGDLNQGKLFYEKALELRKKILFSDHPDLAVSYNSMAAILHKMANYKESVLFYLKASEIRKRTLGEKHPYYASSLNNLGELYRIMGDYKAAESYYQQALEIRKKALGEEHPDVASSLNSLGNVYSDMGDYKAAEPFYKQALEIRKKAFGEEHPDVASSLNSLGDLYSDMGDYKAAEPFLLKALEIKKKTLGEEHSKYANSLNSLGILYKTMGDYKAADPLYKKALEIRKKALGEEHPDVASSLNSLGNVYSDMGDYKAAEPLYKQALGIRKKALGEEHPDYSLTENSFAYLLMKTKREQHAFEILSKNFKKKASEIANNFEWLNDSQKEAYWKKESAFYDNLSWFAIQAFESVPEAVGLNYNAALLTKSKMLEAKISSENFYNEVDELREELAFRRRLLAKMESEGSTEKEKLEKLRRVADSLDKRLTQSWPEYAQQKKNLSITWDQVQQNLDNGEAAIEFVRFFNEDDSLYYYNALVLKPGEKYPILVKLCQENQLKLIQPTSGFSAYYPLIWQPMVGALENVRTIYYSPTGELYNIPFHALYEQKEYGDQKVEQKTSKRGVIVPAETVKTEIKAEYLIDRYTLHQLTSTRYLAMGLKQKAQEPIAKSIAMVGGVNYDFVNSKDVKPNKQKSKINSMRSSQSASGKLAYLEGTKLETEIIKDSVQAKQWKIEMFSSNDATEDNLVRLEGRHAKSILHIATHGYAFPEYDFNDTTINKNSLRYSYRYSTNPMVRSGLILAGGNWAWTGSDTLSKLGAEQNGILTALEVSQLNLKKTKLVVLSACETGLGKIEGSEGTFGLKRGFKLAGVEQMIVSLWSVPDKETMELMTLFYSDLTKTLNPVLSFETAQKEMRNRYPTDPEKWAGFVLVR